jgi:hypothetical protein
MKEGLSGWHRLGIVFSVLWVLSVSGFATFEMLKGAPFGEFTFVEFIPDNTGEAITQTDSSTGKTITLKPVKAVLRAQYLVVMAGVPVLSAWLLAYLMAWTVRWVKKGFQHH